MPSLPLEADDPPRIGRYRLTGRLGEGGQGVVYLAEAPDGRKVAIKVLKTVSQAALKRFAREMEAAKRVAPFCTAAVLESSTQGRHPYVVSEYVEGPSLQQRVRERGPLSGGELDRLMINTASALTAIHGAGVVHRDLKPSNVLLGPDGPRVVDFGIARAVDAETHTQMVGTPAYFAPEWLRGEPPTPASDVFAWAGTMVFAATGRPPFGAGGDLPALLYRIANEPPDLSGVPERVRGLLAECLDKDPARRPTARNLLIRLADPSADAESADGRPQVPQPPPVPQFTQPDGGAAAGRSGKGAGRTLALAGGAVAVLAVLVPAVAFSLLKGDPPGPDPTPTASVTSAGTTAPTAPASDGGTSTATSPAGQGGVTIPAAFAGTWKGRVSQPSVLGGELASDVTIVLREGASEGDADYPGWGCTNRLHLSRSDGSVLEFDETVIRNTGGCRGGVVRLTLQGDRLDYESPGDGLFSQTSRGTLRRG
ncbi:MULTISPECIES: serine/threonine-protein kinase [Thermomonospora]|uniref:Serine/threonine protein kinase n=1 Tax=Thermomonospora curvata (strain ATCC 19995 / DSM 43183 / JCM 3096 / KCTC 9072 / NBRC 15933 / NCIMB 10081 / Henssen B9) TaxID=471852 RepID=D1ABW6_THECD|nr:MULTISPECIES: serine/threonine-protein kinase [Thermomonospora]ACY99139.1 serine/threonine protein kinase [Thermomonospora curvata DSM 43183]PKK13319.1 MAG: serine/threonine protein kinase [Thermomonospora sp. CIF 1]